MATAIVTDSTAYMPKAELEQYNIHMIPLTVVLNGETYEEEVTLQAEDFYDKIRGGKKLPTSSQPPIGKFVELFEKLAQDYDEVVTIHLSSGISGTYQGALSAGEMVEGIDVYGFDTEVACYMQSMYAIHASKLAAQGANAKQILAHLNEMKETEKDFILVDDLSHLQRGGRLSAASALIGSLLQVKPILSFQNKVIVPYEKIRTKKKALKRIEELLAEDVEKYGELEATVIHSNCEAERDEWLAHLREKFPTVQFNPSYFGAVVGTHLGEGALAMGWFKKIEPKI